MNILITGGAGYIGSLLVPELLSQGHNVTVIDNFMFNQTSLLTSCFNKNLNIIKGDVRDKELLKTEVAKSDAIIPLACIVGAPLCKAMPIEAQSVNSDAIRFISDIKSDDQIMIYPCTNSGYGVGEDGIYCDEKSPLRPISLYGKVKVEAESYLLDKSSAACFRFATIFGTSPRMRLDLLVNDFVYRAFYDRSIVLFEAHFKRNYLHIRDAVNAFVFTLNNYDKMKGETYNVGLSTANLSKLELSQKIKEYIPEFTIIESEIGKDPDQRNYIVSNEKIESLGFKTEFTIDDGIIELIKSFSFIKENNYANF